MERKKIHWACKVFSLFPLGTQGFFIVPSGNANDFLPNNHRSHWERRSMRIFSKRSHSLPGATSVGPTRIAATATPRCRRSSCRRRRRRARPRRVEPCRRKRRRPRRPKGTWRTTAWLQRSDRHGPARLSGRRVSPTASRCAACCAASGLRIRNACYMYSTQGLPRVSQPWDHGAALLFVYRATLVWSGRLVSGTVFGLAI